MTQIERSNKIMRTLAVCLDTIVVNVLFLAFRAVWLRYNEPIVGDNLFTMMLSLTVSYMLSASLGGIIFYYRAVRTDQVVRKSISNILLFLLVWLLVSSILNVGVGLSRPMALYFTVVAVLVTSFRLAYRSVLKGQRNKGKHVCNVVYVGGGSNLVELYEEMAIQIATGYNVLGYFDKEPRNKFNSKCTYLGGLDEIQDFLANNHVDRVYCGLPSKYSDVILPIINYCEGHMIRFFSVPNFRNYCQRRVSLEMFSNVPLLTIREEPLSLSTNRFIKRAFDIVFSLCFLLTAFLPIYIIVGAIIKITSPGPIFFKQKRHGLNGTEFYMYKFRSMKINKDADTVQATENDPRKTKWGNFLRNTSLDELPQFINVLLGDMSIVGPRPHMVKHTEEYSQLINTYMVRHFIKPGVTGWSQVTGFRGETKTYEDIYGRVRGDIWYMEHWTFVLDIYIIYKTVANVVGSKDTRAY